MSESAECTGTAPHEPHQFNGGMHCPGWGDMSEAYRERSYELLISGPLFMFLDSHYREHPGEELTLTASQVAELVGRE